MEWFLYIISILLFLSIMVKLTWVKEGVFPKRTYYAEVLDIFFNTILVCWAVYLIWSL